VKRRAVRLLYPTPAFVGLLFVLAAMWYAASSQSNAAAYVLFFALAAVFAVSIPHTLLNLSGLEATTEGVKPAFAGDEVSLPIEIINDSRRPRYGLCVDLPGSGGDAERIDQIAAGDATRVVVRFPAAARGEYEIGRFLISSVYPLGFVRAVSRLQSRERYIVYPKPTGDRKLPSTPAHSAGASRQPELRDGDDFAGVRAYIPGESQRHIDWKAVARGQPLMTKQYAAETTGVLELDYAAVRADNPEDRLSQLALWIIEAERGRRPYRLRLPGNDVPPSTGDAHFHRCLRALALFR
jgi:uncharacterized protein (DUF58 family)